MVSGTEETSKAADAAAFIDAAKMLRSRGCGIVWLRAGEKRPTAKRWTLKSHEPKDYRCGSNLGLQTGRLSGDLVCVDLDSIEALIATDDYLPLTDMVDGRPGKPRAHRWYRVTDIPPEMSSTAAGGIGGPWLKHFPGIDFLGTGGQAVVPPSRHESGERRIWYADGEPAVIPMSELWDAVTCLAKLCGWEPSATNGTSNGHYTANAPVVGRARKYLASIPGAISGQRGHDRTFHAACVLTHGFALSTEDAYPLLSEWNAKCRPPWSEVELKHKLDDAAARPGPRGRLLETPLTRRPRQKTKSSANGRHTSAEAGTPPDDALPEIRLQGAGLQAVTDLAWSALRRSNSPPRLFRYGAVPSRIEQDDDGAPIVRVLTKDRMRHELARVAEWTGEDGAIFAPKDVAADVLATPDPALPVLTRIVESPVFAEDGSLHTEPGYGDRTRTYFAPAADFNVPEVPKHPTMAQIEDAVELLAVELLGEFPFVGECEKAHALAALLLPFVRDMIAGPTPLHSVEAPQPGTGKTLLVDIITHPAVGRPVAMMTEGRDEDEWRKRLFAKLRSGPSIVIIDNVRRRIDSGALASAVTAYPLWEDRILGQSEIVRLPVRCSWLLTGNNPALSPEMTRRTIRCRLDAKVDQPWLRTGFRHTDLRGWARANRGRIVQAALTIIQAWIAAGKPVGDKTLGMFESWAQVIGGILDVADVKGFLGNLQEFYAEADTDTAAWQAFVGAWWTAHGDQDRKAAELWNLAIDAGLNLGDKSEQSQKIRLGLLVRDARDRVFTVGIDGGPQRVRLESAGDHRRAKLRRLRDVPGV